MSVGLPTSMSYLHVMSYYAYEKNIVKDYFCFRPMIDVVHDGISDQLAGESTDLFS